MAKRLPSSRVTSPYSASLVSAKSPRGLATVTWPSICEYPISSLAVLKDLPIYSSIALLSIIVMTCLVMLCALRENSSESNAEYDSRPFVRFIKKNVFGSSDGLVVATCLAVVPALGLIDVSTPIQVENFIKAAISNYKPNVKAPKQLNPSNVEVWVNGQISRILGLMNSCPASVAGLYNFGLTPGQSCNFSIQNIVKSIPLPNKPTWSQVVVSFRVIMGIVKRDSNGDIFSTGMKPLVFNETPLNISTNNDVRTKGLSNLEHQMFVEVYTSRDGGSTLPGVEMKRELDPTTLTFPNEKTKTRLLEVEDLEKFLSPLELASYRSASKIGIKGGQNNFVVLSLGKNPRFFPTRLIELNQKAATRKAQSETDGQPQPAESEGDLAPLAEFAKEASSSRKRGRSRSEESSPTPQVSASRTSPSVDADDQGGKPDLPSFEGSSGASTQDESTSNE